jgi:TatD DNase family protein
VLIDTHCHLHDPEFFSESQAEEFLKEAKNKGVEKTICIGTDVKDSLKAAEFAKNHKNVYYAFGTHPENHDLKADAKLPKNDPKLVAIGEVGLDYHQENYNREAQIQLFNEMLQLAQDNNLPLSFHVREAFDDFFPIIANFPKVRGVVHSFTDNKKKLKRILTETDFYVGVNGLVTYSTLPMPPLERILLETDAPFLTPAPFRGIVNRPGYIREIAEWLSSKLALEFEIVERETTKNARELFHI